MTRSRLTDREAAFVHAARLAHLATASERSEPHVVPICFAYDGFRFFTPLDEKPKRVDVRELRRVRNILATGRAALLIDRYDDDWSRLGYLQIRGRALLLEPGIAEHGHAVALLRGRYRQYRAMDLESAPIIALAPDAVVSWGTLDALSPGPEPTPWSESPSSRS